MPTSFRVKMPELRDLQADLEAVRLGLGREVGAVRREATGLIAGRAKDFVPRTKYPERRGGLAASLEGRGAGVVSTKPQGPVHEFGGTIAPRGVPIEIRRSAMTEKAAAREQGRVERRLEQRVDELLARHF